MNEAVEAHPSQPFVHPAEAPSAAVVELPTRPQRQRPAGLIYAVNERPPPRPLVLLGLQHMAVVTTSLVIPLLVARAAGVDAAALPAILAMSMLAIAVASLIQAFPLGRFGSGYLSPASAR